MILTSWRTVVRFAVLTQPAVSYCAIRMHVLIITAIWNVPDGSVALRLQAKEADVTHEGPSGVARVG